MGEAIYRFYLRDCPCPVESVCAFTWALTVGFQVTSGMCICLVGTVLTLMECTFSIEWYELIRMTKRFWGWLLCNGLILPWWSLVWGAGPGGKHLPNMPGLLAWNAWYGNLSLKTHQLHLLNFFWAKDHIFGVTVEKDGWKNTKKIEKEKT